MTPDRWRISLLAARHDRGAFASGSEPLDRYLRQQAGQDQRKNVAAVYVLVDETAGDIAGYYTLSATAIAATDLPEAITKRLPRYPLLPAILLGRLAIDRRFQGQGRGEDLLLDALARSDHLREQLGAVAVIVDAKDGQAAAFYRRYGFAEVVDSAAQLYLTMTTIAQLRLPAPE